MVVSRSTAWRRRTRRRSNFPSTVNKRLSSSYVDGGAGGTQEGGRCSHAAAGAEIVAVPFGSIYYTHVGVNVAIHTSGHAHQLACTVNVKGGSIGNRWLA